MTQTHEWSYIPVLTKLNTEQLGQSTSAYYCYAKLATLWNLEGRFRLD